VLEYIENPTVNGSINLIFFCGGGRYIPTAGFVGVFWISFSAVENHRILDQKPAFYFLDKFIL